MQTFFRIKDWFGRRAENLLVLLLGSMFVTFIAQIVFRYILAWPVGWTVEWVAIAWLWGILFGYAFVVKDADIIKLDLLYAAVPRSWQRVFDVITGLSIAGVMLYSLPAVYDYVTFMKIERTAYMRVRFDYVFSIYLAFSIAVSIRSLLDVWRAISGRTHPLANSHPEGHDNV